MVMNQHIGKVKEVVMNGFLYSLDQVNISIVLMLYGVIIMQLSMMFMVQVMV